MDWTQLKIYTSTEGLEVLTGILLDIGINGFAVDDPNDFYSCLEEMKDSWDVVDNELLNLEEMIPSISIYLGNNPQGKEQLKEIDKAIKNLKKTNTDDFLGSLEIELLNVKEEDWENNWKEFFKPFNIGQKLLIKPTWEKVDNIENRTIIEIDPGASFGTGMHETTQLCLLALEDFVKEGASVLDVGSGSGILSIAAAKLGAKRVLGIDIDEVSVNVATKAAKANGVEDIAEFFTGDLAKDVNESFDIMVANIFAHILVRLTPDAARLIKKGGIYLTSGIIMETLDDVLKAYEDNDFEILKVENKGEWCLVAGKKR